MNRSIAHAFIDGAYLRKLAWGAGLPLADPRKLALRVVNRIRSGASASESPDLTALTLARVLYYDARPEEDSRESELLRAYWDSIELLPDTELGFGTLRGRRPVRQKGVDTLLAVHLLVGAFNRLFDSAVVIAGDADFVPVVREVRRYGVRVIVAADDKTVAEDLQRVADRYERIHLSEGELPSLKVGGSYVTALDIGRASAST
jgi:hypothetical protein